jgi:nicotinamidase-related amidase
LCTFAFAFAFSTLPGTNLDFLLRQKRAKNVVLGGFLTNWKVYSTAQILIFCWNGDIPHFISHLDYPFYSFGFSPSCVESTMRTAYELNYNVYTLR